MAHLAASTCAWRVPVAAQSTRQHTLQVVAARRAPLRVQCNAIALPTAPSFKGNGAATEAWQALKSAIADIPAVPQVQPGVLPPAAAYDNVVKAGAAKAALPAWKSLLMGIMAGCYISFGGFLAVSVGGSLAGHLPVGLLKLLVGCVFPFGLMINLVVGGELFTGNTAFVTAALIEKKATLRQLAQNWACSYVGNFIGSLLMVGLAVSTGLLAGNAQPINMALAKTSLTFGQAFVRGVLCNWLVCCAVWMAASATTLPGKTLGCWLPVTAFVTMGLEHSVANMFFIFAGIALGAQVTVGQALLANLLPVTLGNVLGGVLCMAVAYALCYGSLGKEL